MLNLSETEKAYLAGLFDGEGCIGLYNEKKSNYFATYLYVTNTDFRAAKWLTDRVPYGKIKPRVRYKNKPVWEWLVRKREHVKEILQTLLPYLVIKVDQASVLLSYMDEEDKSRGNCAKNTQIPPEMVTRRTEISNELKRLKQAPTQTVQ